MSVSSLSIDNTYLNANTLVVVDEFHDADHIECPFLNEQKKALGGDKSQFHGAGESKWITRWNLGSHSVSTEMPTGYERIGLSVSPIKEVSQFEPFKVVRPVVLSGVDEALAGMGAERLAGEADDRVQKSLMGLMREVEQHIWDGSVFANILSLNGSDYLASGGLLEPNAIGSQTGNIGTGFARSSFASTPGVQNLYATIAGNFNANGLRVLYEIKQKTRIYGIQWSKARVFGHESAVTNYQRTLQPQERYIGAKTLDATQAEVAMFGQPCIPVDWMPDSGTTTATTPWSLVIIDYSSIRMEYMKAGKQNGEFGVTEWKDVSGDYDVRACRVEFFGQLRATNQGMNRCALIVDGNTF